MTLNDLFLQERKIISVLPAAPLIARSYSYALPEGVEELSVGTIVQIPLGNRFVTGVVWDTEPEPVKNTTKIKEIQTVYDTAYLSDDHISFIKKVADYTYSPIGAILKMTFSASNIFEAEPTITAYEAISTSDDDVYYDVLEYLKDTPRQTAAQITAATGFSAGRLKTMVKKGFLEQVQITSPPPCTHPNPDRPSVGLSKEQHLVASQLIRNIKETNSTPSLLDGVTGSGKTEVYFEAVAEALKQGKQILILLPEIALSNAFIGRFEKRFGCRPALWHSSLSPAQRRKTWKGVIRGETKVIVGARSSLFLPYKDLGLIIVDEEHDPAFKQEDQVIYHARDMAVLRAHIGHIPIALVSATPSLETIHNVWSDRYQHLQLPARYGGAKLPDIHIVDMREHKPPSAQYFISEPLKAALEEAYNNNNQGLLFLNRRGYAPLTICRDCGHRQECPNCTAWLVEHKGKTQLLCHHCGFQAPYPDHCSSCGSEDSLAACGPGVERIAEEVQTLFPKARVDVLSSDLNENEGALQNILDKIKNHETDIIIGTQILAKGHHFPKLTCVGVIDADLGLEGGDLRATEKTYQLLHQVAGRAGREAKEGDTAGQVFVQTYMADHPVIHALASGDRDAFLKAELQAREHAHMPPFSRLVSLIVTSPNQDQALQTARALAQSAPISEGFQVLGPAPAPLAKLRGKYRFRLLVIAPKNLYVQKTLGHWLEHIKPPSATRIYTDIDPYSFL